MPKISFDGILRKVVETSPEMPFLALTSKIENLFRDKFAYILYKEFYEKNKKKKQFKISREWTPKRGAKYHGKIRRVDLAVFKKDKPIILIEFKAMYSFNGLSKPKEYPGKVKTDLDKIDNCPDAKGYAVLLATHLKKKTLDDGWEDTIKYVYEIKKALKDKSPDEIEEECKTNIEAQFKRRKCKIIDSDTLHLREAYGIKADLLYWIIQKRKN